MWHQAMYVVRARQQIEMMKGIQAAMHPEHSAEYRAAVGRIAYSPDSDELVAYVGSIANEKVFTLSE